MASTPLPEYSKFPSPFAEWLYDGAIGEAQDAINDQASRLHSWLKRQPGNQTAIAFSKDLQRFNRLLTWAKQVRILAELTNHVAYWNKRSRVIQETKATAMESGYRLGWEAARKVYDQTQIVDILLSQIPPPTDDDLADMYADFPWLQKMETIHANLQSQQAA